MPKSKETKNNPKDEKKTKKKEGRAKDALKAGQRDKADKKKKTRRAAGKKGDRSKARKAELFEDVISILRSPHAESFKKAMIGHWMDEHEKEQEALKKEGVI
jgi:hypothetical protein